MKFKKKILAMVLPAVIISISAMAAMVVFLNYGYMKNTAKQTAIYGASSCTERIEGYFNEYVNCNESYRDLANNFDQIPLSYRRNYYNNITRLFLERRKELIATWLSFFPNKLDSSDSKYKGDKYYHSNGAFLTIWTRSNGKIYRDVEFGTEHEDFEADYYLRPIQEKNTVVVAPYFFSYTGKDEDAMLLTSISSPVISSDGEVLGVAGIDLSIEHIKKIMYDFMSFRKCNALLIDKNGDIIFHQDTSRLGVNISEFDDFNYLVKGLQNSKKSQTEETITTDSDLAFEIIIPIRIGVEKKAMFFVLSVPYSTLFEEARIAMVFTILGATIALMAIIIVVVLIVRRGSPPLSSISAAAIDLAEGKLNTSIPHMGIQEIDMISNSITKVKNIMQNILDDIDEIVDSTSGGDFNSRLNTELYTGIHKEIVHKVNQIFDNFCKPIKLIDAYVSDMSGGNVLPNIAIKGVGILNNIKENLIKINNIHNDILADSTRLLDNVISGNTYYRVSTDLYQGDSKKIINNFNLLSDVFVEHLDLFNSTLEKIIQGPHIEPVTEEVEGDFVLIRINLNRIIDIINNYLMHVVFLVDSISSGNLTVTILEKDFNDRWKIVLSGINHVYMTLVNITNIATQVLTKINNANHEGTDYNRELIPHVDNNNYKGELSKLIYELNELISFVNEQTKKNIKNNILTNSNSKIE